MDLGLSKFLRVKPELRAQVLVLLVERVEVLERSSRPWDQTRNMDEAHVLGSRVIQFAVGLSLAMLAQHTEDLEKFAIVAGQALYELSKAALDPKTERETQLREWIALVRTQVPRPTPRLKVKGGVIHLGDQ